MNSPTEKQDCKTLVQWFDLQYPEHAGVFLFLGVESKRGPVAGRELKACGYKRGTPDYLLALPRGGSAGLFLEMKRLKPKGRLSPEQNNMLAELKMRGYRIAVCYGFEDARECLSEYMVEPFTVAGIMMETPEEIAECGGIN